MAIPYRAPDSSRRGFLAPGTGAAFSLDIPTLGFDQSFWDPPPHLNDDDLDNFFQQMVAGIVGLDGSLVRPRWQEEPPDLPPYGTDWAAVAATTHTPLGPWSAIIHDPLGDGRDWQFRDENVDVPCSFYGPHCGDNADLLRDGLLVAQNRETLYLKYMGFFEVGNALRVPALIKNRWTNKYDVTFVISRVVIRVWPVFNLISAGGVVTTNP